MKTVDINNNLENRFPLKAENNQLNQNDIFSRTSVY